MGGDELACSLDGVSLDALIDFGEAGDRHRLWRDLFHLGKPAYISHGHHHGGVGLADELHDCRRAVARHMDAELAGP